MASNGDDDDIMRDRDELELTDDDDVQTPEPVSGKSSKRKGKEPEKGSGSGVKKKTRSWVWEHFTRKSDNYDKCTCNYCGKSLGCVTKDGTSTLKKHIEITCKAFRVWQSANKDQDQTVLNAEGSGGNVKLCRVSETVFREATNELLVLAELPLAFIDSLAWRHFCSKTKQYRPHSRRTTTRDIVLMYVNKKAAMKRILGQSKQRVSLTTDIWVAPVTQASYMVITAHFVDATWELKKMIIGFKNVSDHTGSTICNVLLECLADWNIKKVFCITVDNATANTNAMKKLKEAMHQIGDDAMVLKGDYLHLRCATHILNLIVREGLQEVDYSVSGIRNGIQYVRASPNRLKAFDFRADTVKVKRGSLPLDVKTRWNSTYLMLEQAMKFRVAFEKMEAEDKSYNDYFKETVEGKKRIGPPVEEDWDAVDKLVQILVIFYKSTLILSASKTVASHKLYHEIVTITTNLIALSNNGGTDLELNRKALSMLGKLGKYWDIFGEKVEFNKLVIVASVFDPRKKMKFAEVCFDRLYGEGSVKSTHLCDSVIIILKDLYEEYSRLLIKPTRQGTESSSQSQGNSSQSQEHVSSKFCERTILGNGLGYERMEDVFENMVRGKGNRKSLNELELYLKDDLETSDVLEGTEYDVLSFWKVNSGKFPVLSPIAKDILALQVSSVASESAFSTSGRVLDPYRSCLTHYMIEVLMCTEQWLKCEIHINEKGVSSMTQMLAEVELEDELMREFDPEFTQA